MDDHLERLRRFGWTRRALDTRFLAPDIARWTRPEEGFPDPEWHAVCSRAWESIVAVSRKAGRCPSDMAVSAAQRLYRSSRSGIREVRAVAVCGFAREAAIAAIADRVRELLYESRVELNDTYGTDGEAYFSSLSDPDRNPTRRMHPQAVKLARKLFVTNVLEYAQFLGVADLLDWQSPIGPLIEVWRLGAFPVGVYRGQFWISVPTGVLS